MKSSLEYWEKRWEEEGENFNASWPDTFARVLELKYLLGVLKQTPRSRIVEIGCGAFGLAEFPKLVEEIAQTPYFGMDGSDAALTVARKRFSMGTFHQMNLADVRQPLPYWDRGAFLISKRTIQNIHDEESRIRLLKWVSSFTHGVLIEDFLAGRLETDRVRRDMGLPHLEIPEFNVPLNRADLECSGRLESPLGYYNLVTRAQPDVPEGMRFFAFKLSLEAIAEGRPQPLFGPVVAYVW